MLLYQKPLTEIGVGESFQVTVTEADWKRAINDPDNTIINPTRCVLAVALQAQLPHEFAVSVGPYNANAGPVEYAHDGYRLV